MWRKRIFTYLRIRYQVRRIVLNSTSPIFFSASTLFGRILRRRSFAYAAAATAAYPCHSLCPSLGEVLVATQGYHHPRPACQESAQPHAQQPLQVNYTVMIDYVRRGCSALARMGDCFDWRYQPAWRPYINLYAAANT